MTLSEIASHLKRRHGERFAPSTVWRFLDRHALTFKKNRAMRPARRPRWPGGAGGRCAARAAWLRSCTVSAVLRLWPRSPCARRPACGGQIVHHDVVRRSPHSCGSCTTDTATLLSEILSHEAVDMHGARCSISIICMQTCWPRAGTLVSQAPLYEQFFLVPFLHR